MNTKEKINERLLEENHRLHTYERNLLAINSQLATVHAVIHAAFPKAILHIFDHIVFDVRELESFAAMGRVIEALENFGISADSWTTSDYPESFNRDFKVKIGEIYIKVSLYLDKATTNCKLVEVSRESVERINYRMDCGEQEQS